MSLVRRQKQINVTFGDVIDESAPKKRVKNIRNSNAP